MANSSIRPSTRTVPAHAGAAHAARRVTPQPTPGTRCPPSPRHTAAQASPAAPCTSQAATVPRMGTQSGKQLSCSVHKGRRGFVPQEPLDQSSPCASGLFREVLQ